MANELDDAIAHLRRLNEPVPRPLRLPTEAEVLAVEAHLGIRFPVGLRRYLLEASDIVVGTMEPVTIDGGHTAVAAVLRRARESGVPEGLIPVCEDNGDYYCIEPTGEVVFWSHNGSGDERWRDLATWISEVWIGGR